VSPRASTEAADQILLGDRWRPGPPPRLLACRCAAESAAAGCDEVFFPPRPLCPTCWGPTEVVELPTDGTLYTFTTVQVPSDHAEAPYMLGYADLGRVRVLGHLVGGPPRIGAPVTVTTITVGAAAGHGGPGLVYAFRVAAH
jgi:uncharacterized protein